MDILNELDGLSKEDSIQKQKAIQEDLKITLDPLVSKMKRLKEDKIELELALSNIINEMDSVESEIRRLWAPFIEGAESASLLIGDIKLKSEQKINVSVAKDDDARDNAISWLCENGYKDCMKYDINTNRMKAIALRLLKDDQTQIPGLKYSSFNKISIGE